MAHKKLTMLKTTGYKSRLFGSINIWTYKRHINAI
jgi:hypothetical protein